jgi:hypothetical protein
MRRDRKKEKRRLNREKQKRGVRREGKTMFPITFSMLKDWPC